MGSFSPDLRHEPRLKVTFSPCFGHEPGLKVPLVSVYVSNPDESYRQSEFKRATYLYLSQMCGGVEMTTRARAKVRGLEFKSLYTHPSSPNKQL